MYKDFNAREIIQAVYGYAGNLITPNERTYYQTGRTSIEFSSGPAPFSKQTLYGVTVVRLRVNGTLRRARRLSNCFDALEDMDVPYGHKSTLGGV